MSIIKQDGTFSQSCVEFTKNIIGINVIFSKIVRVYEGRTCTKVVLYTSNEAIVYVSGMKSMFAYVSYM